MPTGPKQIIVMGTNAYSCQIKYLIRNWLGSKRRRGFEEEKYANKVKPCNPEMSYAGIETEPKNRCGLWSDCKSE